MTHDEIPNRPKEADSGENFPNLHPVLKELEIMAGSLENLARSVRRLQGVIPQILPKMPPIEADESKGESKDDRREEPPAVSPDSSIDVLVEEQFLEVFGEEDLDRAFEASAISGQAHADDGQAHVDDGQAQPAAVDKNPVPEGDTSLNEAPSKRATGRATGLWLRVRQGKRVLDIPWQWVRDVSPPAGGRAGRLHLEDETGEAEISVDEFQEVVTEGSEKPISGEVVRLSFVQDLVPIISGTPTVTHKPTHEPIHERTHEPTHEFMPKPAFQIPQREPEPVKRVEKSTPRRVQIVSPSGIVRRFLKSHLESMGMEVYEQEKTFSSANGGEFLGIFLDRDHAQLESSVEYPEMVRYPIVFLSHDVDSSNLSSETGTPILAKPFSRGDVGRALAWMRRRYHITDPDGLISHDEIDTPLDDFNPKPGDGPAPENRPR